MTAETSPEPSVINRYDNPIDLELGDHSFTARFSSTVVFTYQNYPTFNHIIEYLNDQTTNIFFCADNEIDTLLNAGFTRVHGMYPSEAVEDAFFCVESAHLNAELE